MTEYTTIYFDYGIYHSKKVKVKKIISSYGLLWNHGKIKDLSVDEMLKVFEVFKCGDKTKNDNNLRSRAGSSGVWKSGNNSVKIIMFNKVREDEHLPVLMIVKGESNIFYQKFIKYVVGLGCEVGKVVESEDGKFEEIFKKKINVELVEKLNNVELIKESIKNNFLCHMEELKRHGVGMSESFIKGWIDCIYKYGEYTFNMLIQEIEKKNKKIDEGISGVVGEKEVGISKFEIRIPERKDVKEIIKNEVVSTQKFKIRYKGIV